MTTTPQPPSATETDTTSAPATTWLLRALMGIVLTLVVVLLTAVIVTPIALSSQDLIQWATAPTGLRLSPPWPMTVALSLDAAAGCCVLLAVYCAWRGEPAGAFGLLVWTFAAGSAFANWRHGTAPGAAPDAWWFFPAMSLLGPALLEVVLGRLRRWAQRVTGRRHKPIPAFGWRRWLPGLGAFRDTYGAYRTALLLGIDTIEDAITTYHQLCPDGGLRIAAALRARHVNRPHLTPAAAATELDPAARDLSGHLGEHLVSTAELAAGLTGDLPVDLMRRIPVNPEPYRRWQQFWAELHTTLDPQTQDAAPDLQTLADQHQVSRRHIEYIRSAGQAGLLDHPVPPARLLATLSAILNAATPGPAVHNHAEHDQAGLDRTAARTGGDIPSDEQ